MTEPSVIGLTARCTRTRQSPSLPRLLGSALHRKVAGDPDHVWVKPLA